VYERLYSEYKTLYDYFGRDQNEVMKRLRALRREALAPQERAEEAALESNALPDATEQNAFSG
jgi:L-ribulokinase